MHNTLIKTARQKIRELAKKCKAQKSKDGIKDIYIDEKKAFFTEKEWESLKENENCFWFFREINSEITREGKEKEESININRGGNKKEIVYEIKNDTLTVHYINALNCTKFPQD